MLADCSPPLLTSPPNIRLRERISNEQTRFPPGKFAADGRGDTLQLMETLIQPLTAGVVQLVNRTMQRRASEKGTRSEHERLSSFAELMVEARTAPKPTNFYGKHGLPKWNAVPMRWRCGDPAVTVWSLSGRLKAMVFLTPI